MCLHVVTCSTYIWLTCHSRLLSTLLYHMAMGNQVHIIDIWIWIISSEEEEDEEEEEWAFLFFEKVSWQTVQQIVRCMVDMLSTLRGWWRVHFLVAQRASVMVSVVAWGPRHSDGQWSCCCLTHHSWCQPQTNRIYPHPTSTSDQHPSIIIITTTQNTECTKTAEYIQSHAKHRKHGKTLKKIIMTTQRK